MRVVCLLYVFSALLIPWCTYTEPEVAHVGLYPRDLDDKGIAYETYTKQFSDVDRAILEGSCSTTGFVKVYAYMLLLHMLYLHSINSLY